MWHHPGQVDSKVRASVLGYLQGLAAQSPERPWLGLMLVHGGWRGDAGVCSQPAVGVAFLGMQIPPCSQGHPLLSRAASASLSLLVLKGCKWDLGGCRVWTEWGRDLSAGTVREVVCSGLAGGLPVPSQPRGHRQAQTLHLVPCLQANRHKFAAQRHDFFCPLGCQ